MELDFSKLKINEIKEEINLILWNNGYGDLQTMKETNILIERIKNVKIYIN